MMKNNKLLAGQYISLYRKKKKLTQEQLAEKLNVTNRSVSKWERREKFS